MKPPRINLPHTIIPGSPLSRNEPGYTVPEIEVSGMIIPEIQLVGFLLMVPTSIARMRGMLPGET